MAHSTLSGCHHALGADILRRMVSGGDLEQILDPGYDESFMLLFDSDREKLAKGNYRGPLPSINQTTDFTCYTPIFLNVSFSCPSLPEDPRIPLSIWIAAEFKKRVLEGWDRSMPVTAVVISGHKWELYVVYDPDYECNDLTNVATFY
jgi:hypothetical protein